VNTIQTDVKGGDPPKHCLLKHDLKMCSWLEQSISGNNSFLFQLLFEIAIENSFLIVQT
jgi:hypothetical protein